MYEPFSIEVVFRLFVFATRIVHASSIPFGNPFWRVGKVFGRICVYGYNGRFLFFAETGGRAMEDGYLIYTAVITFEIRTRPGHAVNTCGRDPANVSVKCVDVLFFRAHLVIFSLPFYTGSLVRELPVKRTTQKTVSNRFHV